MNTEFRTIIGFLALAGLMTLSSPAWPQQRASRVSPRAVAYDAKQEVLVQGTVLKYSEKSASLPLGTHVTVQTPTGTIDVHLGPSSYLRSNHFSLAPGDSVRFIGAISSSGKNTVLLARIAQKGGQALAIRSTQGFLLATGAARSLSKEQRAQAALKETAR